MENVKAGMPYGMSDRRSRVSTLMAARCVGTNGNSCALKVRTLSDTGLSGECDEHAVLSIGERVYASLRHVENIPGQIVRIEQRLVSIRFSIILDSQRLGLKGWWDGPSFEVEERHKTGQKCWRPGITIGSKT
jgi:hypothetical protein